MSLAGNRMASPAGRSGVVTETGLIFPGAHTQSEFVSPRERQFGELKPGEAFAAAAAELSGTGSNRVPYMSCRCSAVRILVFPADEKRRERTVSQDGKEASQAQASDSLFLSASFGYPGTQQLIQPLLPSHATLFDPYFNGKRCATRHTD